MTSDEICALLALDFDLVRGHDVQPRRSTTVAGRRVWTFGLGGFDCTVATLDVSLEGWLTVTPRRPRRMGEPISPTVVAGTIALQQAHHVQASGGAFAHGLLDGSLCAVLTAPGPVYRFELRRDRVLAVGGPGASEAAVRVAVALAIPSTPPMARCGRTTDGPA